MKSGESISATVLIAAILWCQCLLCPSLASGLTPKHQCCPHQPSSESRLPAYDHCRAEAWWLKTGASLQPVIGRIAFVVQPASAVDKPHQLHAPAAFLVAHTPNLYLLHSILLV